MTRDRGDATPLFDPVRLSDRVVDVVRTVARVELLPRLSGAAATASTKAPGEVVTEADLAAERALAGALGELLPGAAIIGEESAHADARLLDGLARHPWAWIVDPLDGTRHFAQGEGPFGVMVALLRHGVTEAAWIHLPLTDETATAWRDRGALLDGRPIRVPHVPSSAEWRGGLLTRFFPEPMKTLAEASRTYARTDGDHQCAARRYVDLLTGSEHFAAYWRTLPWDHAPGTLLVEEAGGVVRRFDGASYDPCDVDATGLLVASDDATWHAVRATALGLP